MTDAYHLPVLTHEVTRCLAPALGSLQGPPRGVYVDATCGGGGHAAAMLEATRPASALLLDRDPEALVAARTALHGRLRCPVEWIHARFSQIPSLLRARGLAAVAGVLADLGVSSGQLDAPERGFSFRHDAPLDMRMDPTTGPTAAESIATMTPEALAEILRKYGEEPDARRIAEAVCNARPATTLALADVVVQAMSAPARRKLGTRIHPATRTFQALRMHVNGELEELDALLASVPAVLDVGGRLGVITFHSLEDRKVKRAFRVLTSPAPVPAGLPLRHEEIPAPAFRTPPEARGGLTASAQEVDRNPRARSARLRVIERCAA